MSLIKRGWAWVVECSWSHYLWLILIFLLILLLLYGGRIAESLK